MSIINKMHQDFQQIQEAQPILANMPGKKSKQKALLLLFVLLLTASSLALSYLIFTQQKARQATDIAASEIAAAVTSPAAKDAPKRTAALAEQAIVQTAPVKRSAATDTVKKSLAPAAKTVTPQAPEQKTERKTVIDKEARVASKTPADRKRASPAKAAAALSTQSEKKHYLEIKTAKLSKAQLAQIHLKEAERAQAQGDLELAARKRLQALELLPTLNEVRKSLALYYYGQGELSKASGLLKSGALVSPDYSDFNLMLSRIALKAGDYQKAYLYLEQHPPQLEGHLDYYVSHAILAQKFQNYEQAERLYTGLLSQRPNNGRWRMSLAIAQDKQAKAELALSSYKMALLQPDLSSKAKAYIKQRLTYLERQ